jgi:alkanesulfonate monooxygenase SsuD/methylene tetrahydromethanopterin reductase-like flavin-dependent oxidoreductase (luciferase family)
MEYFANLSEPVADPQAWARTREAEGWDGLGCSEHYWMHGTGSHRPFPHLWVTLSAMACATTKVTLTPAFANNLLRSPVEFAQASLMMQSLSGSRFEAALGAGWLAEELTRTGQAFPDGRGRARALAEALQIVRQLVTTGTCQFTGEHYSIDVPCLGPLSDTPPPIVAAVGSPWTMRHVTPLCDRVELKMGRTTRGGALDFAALASVTLDEVVDMVATVRRAKPDVPVSVLAFVAAGDSPTVQFMAKALGNSFYGSLCGDPGEVAETLASLSAIGVDRVQVTEFAPDSFTALAPLLVR